ncbi:uncharacterized protein METZ01_LOCUS345326, partial [marine metagenome]
NYLNTWISIMPNTFHTPFGPLLMQSQLSDTTFTILVKQSRSVRYNLNNDFRSHLAGNLEEEYGLDFSSSEKSIVHNELISIAKEYMKEAKRQKRIKKFGRPKVNDIQIVEPIWVNYMKAGEWNPSHFHAGVISCIIYLKVPNEIQIENKVSESSKMSNQPSAGKIQWTYGENIHFSGTFFNQIPKEGDIWLFPADLKHFVYPFKSDVERISISCNFK